MGQDASKSPFFSRISRYPISSMPVPIAALNDIDIYFELHGDGPPLLNIGGSGQTLANSQPEVSPLNAHFTVCHFDQRGLGRTTIPEEQWTMADYADDAAALLGHLGWDSAAVVGTSFGGMVAQNLAVRHPQRIERLVLACTSSGGAGGSSADLLELEERAGTEDGNDAWLSLIDTRNDPANGTLAPGMEMLLQYFDRRDEAADDDATRAGFMGQLTARRGHDVYDALANFEAPTLVIGGRYDGLAPPENLRALAARLANARLEMCDGGHVFMWQDPTAWTTIIEFLTEGVKSPVQN